MTADGYPGQFRNTDLSGATGCVDYAAVQLPRTRDTTEPLPLFVTQRQWPKRKVKGLYYLPVILGEHVSDMYFLMCDIHCHPTHTSLDYAT